eukprot:jgi/Tetstr1/441447/TSEL_029692.t1
MAADNDGSGSSGGESPGAGGSRATALAVDALAAVQPSLGRLQEAAQRAGRKYHKLASDCKTLQVHLEDLIKSPPPLRDEPPPAPPSQALVTPDAEEDSASEPKAEEPAAEEAAPEEGAVSGDPTAAAAPPPADEGEASEAPSEVPTRDAGDVAGDDAADAEEAAEAAPAEAVPAPVPAPGASPPEAEGEAEGEAAENGDAAPAAAAAEPREPEIQPADPPASDSSSSRRQTADGSGHDLDAPPRVALERVPSRLEALKSGELPTMYADPNTIVALGILCVLQSGVETRKPPIVEAALECLHRLVMHKLVKGPVLAIPGGAKPGGADGEESSSGPARAGEGDAEEATPQAIALELYCKCEDIADEHVELQVMKGLLTCVTSTSITVHGQALLLAVRSCYNIFLTSRVEVNQATAKASLTQMVNVVFQRMEANNVVVPVCPIVVSDILGVPPSVMADTASVASTVQAFLNKAIDDFTVLANPDSYREGLDAAFTSERGADPIEDIEDPEASDRDHIDWRGGGREADEADPNMGDIPARAAAPEAEGGSDGAEAPAVPTGRKTSDSIGIITGPDVPPQQPARPSSAVLQKDAFLVFRALCKLSIKTADGGQGADPMAIRGKVLSLELLKVLLENSGPVFCGTERFISALKQYLCLSLLKNCAGSNAQAQRLSCSLFLTLVRKFRQSLKAEVGVFFPMILLRAVEPVGGHSNPGTAAATPGNPVGAGQMSVVLKCLKEQCSDGQVLVDLFVNYDCDLEGSNLFERMVSGLVRIAQGHGNIAENPTKQQLEQEAVLQTMATECLVAILRSLSNWYKGATVMPQEQEEEKAAAAEEEGVTSSRSLKHLRGKSLGSLSVEEGEGSPGTAANGSDKALDRNNIESRKAYKTGFQEGIALFNKKPKKGIAFMQEHGMLGTSTEDIAVFLQRTKGLNKTLIGDYLGERDDTCIKVMHAYVDSMDFSGMEFDDAIRMFLADFRLPGEAQKIDRLMEKFAERFFMCSPENMFKSADVAYVLAFSVIMLNTDAHNPMVKVKMSRDGFLNNNRGINDGQDLPADYLANLYDRIQGNEIKMKDTDPVESMHAAPSAAKCLQLSWIDTVMGMIGRKAVDYNEPSDDAIRRTHEYLKEKAKGATFFTATDGETVRPMIEVAWAPMLGAFSVLFEVSDSMQAPQLSNLCLDGFYHAISLTSMLGMTMLRDTYVTSLSRFTGLHSPSTMTVKSAHALRTLLIAAEHNGNTFQGAWPEVLRCVSRYDMLVQQHSGLPGDNVLFGPSGGVDAPAKPAQRSLGLWGRSSKPSRAAEEAGGGVARAADAGAQGSPGPMGDVDSNMRESRELRDGVEPGLPKSPPQVQRRSLKSFGQWKGAGDPMAAPPPAVLEVISAQELNRLFVHSDRLNSTAIVDFVSDLCKLSLEELANAKHPRVYGLTKIVEIAHFNMNRIRLVWNRIWAVLSDYFITVGCHQNLSVAIFAVDSLRQLAMKFLERDELANYTFQNEFLRPFVVVMRQSHSVEIRELIIRCVSQMVLARVANVKSGWKSMFMVFTTAAQDDAQTIVRLSFETIEKIVREHFAHITETEVTTFTDCVNCLIAFTNNPHSLDVALNAIAFLRFCAMKLADGAIGSVDELPEDVLQAGDLPNPKPMTIRDLDAAGREAGAASLALLHASAALQAELPGSPASIASAGRGTSGRLHFTDKDEHMYFWFPLLVGLSELTFDPRPDIRYSALEVLFDILRYHGKCFSASFWARVFDSVIFPIFDHVRAEVTDTTTFTDDRRRADEDKWLYNTCTKCLQHLVDLFVHFFPVVNPTMNRLLALLADFISRTHQSLAAVGVAALVRLIAEAGPLLTDEHWVATMTVVRRAANDTMPQVSELVWHSPAEAGSSPSREEPSTVYDGAGHPQVLRDWSLGEGLGARRLGEVQCRAAVQLLLVQACGEMYARHCRRLPGPAVVVILDVLRGVSTHARVTDGDMEMRRLLAQKQAADRVEDYKALADPPLLKLESEASHSYLSVLLHINMAPGGAEGKAAACIEERLVELCTANLERYEAVGPFSDANGAGEPAAGGEGGPPSNMSMSTSSAEHSARAPLVVATLRALSALGDGEFKRHLREFFPLLTRLISCQHAPVEVQRALSTLFEKRIGPLIA